MMLRIISTLLFVGAVVAEYTPEALKDQVLNLPGAESLDVSFNQFSGYLTVNTTKHNHYWFVESMGNPSTDPLVFWTNGGPGCSGLLGFLTEQGPFRPNKDLSLAFNEYAWNTVANMVFIEAPCGVGFSYSDNPDVDYHTGELCSDLSSVYINFIVVISFCPTTLLNLIIFGTFLVIF